MAITFKQIIQTAPAAGSSFNLSITPNAAGNLLILGIGMYQKGQVVSVTDNNGNKWIPVIFNQQEGNSGGAVYHVPNCNAGATTVTVTLLAAEADVGLICEEWSGCAQHHPVDGYAVGFGSTGTAVSTANFTTAEVNDVIISFSAFIDQNIASIGGGYTLRSNLSTDAWTAMGDLAAPTAGTYAGHWNAAVNSDYGIMAVGLSSVDNPNPWPVPVQVAVEETTSAGSPITATFTSNVTAGNAIVVMCMGVSGMSWSVTDSENNTYHACAGASVAGCQMFVAFGVAGGTAAAVHAAYTGTFGTSAVYAVEVQDINVYDTGSGNSGTGTTATPGSFTLNKSTNEIVIACTSSPGLAVSNPGGNDSTYLLIQITSSLTWLIEYQTNVTGAQNPVGNMSGSTSWLMIAGGFYQAGTGGFSNLTAA